MKLKKAQLAQAEAKQNGGFICSRSQTKQLCIGWICKQALTDSEQKALNTLNNNDGGFLTTADTSGRIISRLRDFSPMRRYANVKTTGKKPLNWHYQ